jgi:FixJ family two-component response regulator
MPKMVGPELAERLRTTHPDVKVLYISGYTEGFISHLDLLDSRVEFLQKPFTMSKLVKKVQAVLSA